jgi:hypothetical protein
MIFEFSVPVYMYDASWRFEATTVRAVVETDGYRGERAQPLLRQIVTTIAAAVSGLMIIYAAFSLFYNYSEVRYIYYVLSVLFFVTAGAFSNVCRGFGTLVMYTASALLALKAAL